jgi:hypothetical protein
MVSAPIGAETPSQSEINVPSAGHEKRAVGSLQSIPYVEFEINSSKPYAIYYSN